MRKVLSVAALFALMQISFPGGIVRFSGAITAGHIATWSSSGVLQDGGAAPAGATILQNTSNCAVTGVTMTACPGMSFTASANTSYRVTCDLSITVNAGTGQFEWTGPAAPTNMFYGNHGVAGATAFATTLTTGQSGSTISEFTGMALINGTNSGTVQLLNANNTAGDVTTINAGSFCIVQ